MIYLRKNIQISVCLVTCYGHIYEFAHTHTHAHLHLLSLCLVVRWFTIFSCLRKKKYKSQQNNIRLCYYNPCNKTSTKRYESKWCHANSISLKTLRDFSAAFIIHITRAFLLHLLRRLHLLPRPVKLTQRKAMKNKQLKCVRVFLLFKNAKGKAKDISTLQAIKFSMDLFFFLFFFELI